MKARFRSNQAGTAALEFAIISPAMIVLVFGAITAGVAFWTKNALQDTAQETARCAAIASSNCATAGSGCDSANPAICYAEQIAQQRGISQLSASNVSVNSNASYAGASFTVVTINYTVAMAGYSYTLSANASFPN